MSKPPPLRVPSDDCAVSAGGIVYHPHEGEWVELRPGVKVGDLQTFEGLARLKVEMEALDGEPDGYAEGLARIFAVSAQLVPFLRSRIAAWSWTDDDGVPLSQPKDDPPEGPSVFDRLDFQELQYLAIAIRDGSGAQEKNGLSGSPTTSSATSPTPSPV